MEENKNIRHYSAADIQKYVEGKLSAQEMHAIEKAALDDPFLADAIEGIEYTIKFRGSESVNADIGELQNKLSARINDKKKSGTITGNRLWWQVAAALVILIGASGVMYKYLIKNNLSFNKVAQSRSEKEASGISSSKGPAATPRSSPTPPDKTDVASNEIKNQRKPPQIYNPKSKRKAFMHARSQKTDEFKIEKDAGVAAAPINPQGAKKSETLDSASNISANGVTILKNLPSLNKFNDGHEFVGRVVDLNSQPISGAYVNLSDQKHVAITDKKGFFKLFANKSDTTIKITVNSVGFEDAKAILVDDHNIENNTINLRPRNNALSEIVVGRPGARKRTEPKNIASGETLKNAEPVTGWEKFKEYLDKNKRLSGDSLGLKIIEVVTFTIKKNGKPGNFSIQQSFNDDFDAEAIRLIKDGPAWRLLKGKKTRATITIEF